MATFLFYLAAVNLFLALLSSLQLLLGDRLIVKLQDVDISSLPDAPLPRVSIIIPARNEERDIEEALQSLLSQDYDNLEILTVNDRSCDRTGEILDSAAKNNPQLRVMHLTELPPGWVGKNYALHYAAERSSGELLLFTDADVVMAPSTIRRAVVYARDNEIDHLSVWPEVRMPTWLLRSFAIVFALYFNAWIRPWKAKNPKSRAYVGIGAFNLIAAEVYRAIGTHKVIAMRPDDDLKLGKIVKQHGYRQEMLNGIGFIYVPWYASVGELTEGFMKNPSAAVNYNVPVMVLATVPILVLDIWPVIAVFLTTGITRLLYTAVLLVYLLLGWRTAGALNIKQWCVLGFPLAMLLHVYILWRAALHTLINNGISWRDTHYSLAELKANKV